MTHRSELVWLDLTDSIEQIREKVQENLFNIYPVAAGKFDDIKGVVYLKDLFGRIDEPDFSLSQGFVRRSLCRKTRVCIMRWNSSSRHV